MAIKLLSFYVHCQAIAETLQSICRNFYHYFYFILIEVVNKYLWKSQQKQEFLPSVVPLHKLLQDMSQNLKKKKKQI